MKFVTNGKVRRVHQRGDAYPVLMGRGLLGEAGGRLRALWGDRRVGVITHRKLMRLFGGKLRAGLEQAGVDTVFITIPEGERFKTLETARRLYTKLIRNGFGREDGLLALGGGVVGDTAGFVAATYLRGVGIIQVPTTLLGQIDSSIGAKVGINLPQGKNLVGALHRPAAVWIDPELLATLPRRELRSGLFEMLKYGFIGSPSLFRQMERSPEALRPPAPLLDEAIFASARMKLAVVREDEIECGPRRVLNFGHTIGHGLEAAGDYKWLSHGEAVGWGMIAAVRLAHRRRLIGRRLSERMESVVRGLAPLPALGHLSARRVLAAIDRDKKIGRRGFRFVLPIGIGRVRVVDEFPRDEIRWAVAGLGVGSS